MEKYMIKHGMTAVKKQEIFMAVPNKKLHGRKKEYNIDKYQYNCK